MLKPMDGLMILEALSQVFHVHVRQEGRSAHGVAQQWLVGILRKPQPDSQVERVLHAELSLIDDHVPVVIAQSTTGQRLLNSIYSYCQSYEQWQFRRWLHHTNPLGFVPKEQSNG